MAVVGRCWWPASSSPRVDERRSTHRRHRQTSTRHPDPDNTTVIVPASTASAATSPTSPSGTAHRGGTRRRDDEAVVDDHLRTLPTTPVRSRATRSPGRRSSAARSGARRWPAVPVDLRCDLRSPNAANRPEVSTSPARTPVRSRRSWGRSVERAGGDRGGAGTSPAVRRRRHRAARRRGRPPRRQPEWSARRAVARRARSLARSIHMIVPTASTRRATSRSLVTAAGR